ncbi:MAG: hypothetical protein J6Y69_00430 [Treponema sp.]|nr:hypothetical protein [Treponema sp.]
MKRFCNRITKVLAALVISISSLSFISCGELLNFLIPALFGQLGDFTASPGDGFVSLSWDNGYASGYLYIETKETSSNNVISSGSDWLDADQDGFLPTGCLIDELTNGVSYTFTLYLYEQRNRDSNLVTSAVARATPSADGGGTGIPITLDVGAGDYFVELPYNTSNLIISGAQGKMITYANVNSKTTVNKSNVIKASAARRYVSGLRSADTGIQEVASAVSESAVNTASPVRHFAAPDSVTLLPDSGRSADRAGDDPWNKSNPRIGQTKTMYIDSDTNLERFRQEQMKLYAIGYVPGSSTDIACLVWAKESDVGNNSNTKISIGAIDDIVLKFIKHYKFEEEVFGTTSNQLLTANGRTSMDNGDTKNWVNIVLYDIGKDGISGDCGVVGYFWAKDYYKKGVSTSSSDPISLTNEGKYFYVDIPFCNYDSSTGSYQAGSDSVSDTVLSTLFHEYQHMIDFNTKSMEHEGLNTNNCTWYNEMLSMLCEDIMGDQLGLSSDDRVATGRIKNFNAYYYYSGTAQYLDTNSWVSYGTAYAFGAWLVRNYGGVSLIHRMSVNDSVGIDSIVDAVNYVNNYTGSDVKSWNDLFEEYIQACGFRTEFAGNTLPTFNRVPAHYYEFKFNNIDDEITLYYRDSNNSSPFSSNVSTTLEGKLKGINLWSDPYKNKNTYGPVVLGSNSTVDIQPSGFVFHNVGRVTTNEDVTLRFTTTTNQYEKLYIFVQDYEPSNQQDYTTEVTQQ